MVLIGVAPSNGMLSPLNRLNDPSLIMASYAHYLVVILRDSSYILTLIVSRGCPAIVPHIFETTPAIVELRNNYHVCVFSYLRSIP